MSAQPIVVVGAGGLGREVLDVIRAINAIEHRWAFKGFVADYIPDFVLLDRLGVTWLGPVDDYLAAPLAESYVTAVGDPVTRQSWAEQFDARGLVAETLIHPSATLGEDVEIDSGSVVCSHVSITTNVRLGSHVLVNLNATVAHDCRVSDFVTINPLVAVSGNVIIKSMATLGTHSSILQGLLVGAGAFVGAGAVVTRDVDPGTTVVGIPAKPIA